MNHRQLGALAALLIAISGCTSDPGTPTAELIAVPAAVNMCFKQVGSTYGWQALKLESTGDADLIIANLELRGDSSCAFGCLREAADGEPPNEEHPCPQESDGAAGFQMTLPPGSERYVTIAYTPSAAGIVDNAALVITSNAEGYLAEGADWGEMVVPLCGEGFDEGDFPGDDPELDAGIECPVCEAPEPGAPGCEAGYPTE
jgi:hypothetical protein